MMKYPYTADPHERVETAKKLLELFENVYKEEEKVIPPKGTEYLHNCYLNFLKYSIESFEYRIVFEKYGILADLAAGTEEYSYYLEKRDEFSYKSSKSCSRGYEYFNKYHVEYEKYYPSNSTELLKP